MHKKHIIESLRDSVYASEKYIDEHEASLVTLANKTEAVKLEKVFMEGYLESTMDLMNSIEEEYGDDPDKPEATKAKQEIN